MASVTDEASAAAKDIWSNVINHCTDTDSTKSNDLIRYLTEMKEIYASFDFRMAYDHDDGTITSVVRMISVMRSSLEKFGQYITLDAMKHKFNTLLWPYFAPALMREDRSICIACEAIAISECHDAYKYIVNSMFDMAPNACRKDVLIVAADGIMDNNFVRNELQLPNAHFIEDIWHLLNSVLPKTFGKYKFSKMKNDVETMIQAKNESDFDRFALVVRQHVAGSADMLKKYENLLRQRKHYAKYVLSKLPGGLGEVVRTHQNKITPV